jgi:hypothetical protein
VARIQPIVGSAQETLGGLASTVSGVDQLLHTYAGVMKELHPPKPADAAPTPDEPKGPPFDIRDYARTIEGVSSAARDLRELMVELRATLESSAVSRELARTQSSVQAAVADARTSASALIADAQGSTHALLDAALLRAIVLTVVILVAVLIYRAISLRWFRRNQSRSADGTKVQ